MGSKLVHSQVVPLIVSCTHHAKSNRIRPESMQVEGDGNLAARSRAFFKVFSKVYWAYERYLTESRLIDFEDMICLSADSYRRGLLDHNYRLVLVDEFQDVSNSRADLIGSLRANNPGLKIFAVGDDWQSIYRFAGADITNMTHYSDRFGYSATNFLTWTFRSNQTIADVASRFVLKNPAQLKKQVRSVRQGQNGSVEVAFYLGDPDSLIEYRLRQLADRAQKLNRKLSVLILARYNKAMPRNLGSWKGNFAEQLDIVETSIHKAKGLEADIVFLLGNTNRRGEDFPSTVQDDALVGMFMPAEDELLWAEERRLMYVALTRAKEKVYVMSPVWEASSFIEELSDDPEVVVTLFRNATFNSVKDPKSLLKGPVCPKCGKGKVVLKTSQYGTYETCNRGRACNFKRNGERSRSTIH